MVNVDMTKNELLNLLDVFSRLIAADAEYEPSYLYFLSKNKSLALNESKSITEVVDTKLKDYRQALKDEKIVSEKGELLDENKKKEIDERFRKEIDSIEEFLKEKIKCELYDIKTEKLPSKLSSGLFDFFFHKKLITE